MKVRLLLLLVIVIASCARKKEAPPPAPPPPVVKPSGPSHPPVLATFTDNDSPTEERFSLADDLDIRYGPGRDYPIVPGAQALKGARLYVLEEREGWIRFRDARDAGPSAGWIHKFASTPARDPASWEADVHLLVDLGYVAHVDPAANDATVNTNLWNIEDVVIQKGMGRSLAFYCAERKGTQTRWVDIRDSNTGQKVAKFSENMGFVSYLQKSSKR